MYLSYIYKCISSLLKDSRTKPFMNMIITRESFVSKLPVKSEYICIS